MTETAPSTDTAIRQAEHKNDKGSRGGKKRRNGKPAKTGKDKPKEPVSLTTKDQIVDRGTRVVDGADKPWFIIKRATIDTKAFKETKRVYVVRIGEGADAIEEDATSLGQAREKVGKTIVHPEPAAKPAPVGPKTKK